MLGVRGTVAVVVAIVMKVTAVQQLDADNIVLVLLLLLASNSTRALPSFYASHLVAEGRTD